MPRAIPILVIIGLAIYSFFDVLQSEPGRIRRLNRSVWLVLVLIPVVGAALWFLIGRPSRRAYTSPRVIQLRPTNRPKAPDDDPAFLRKLDEEAWRRKRDAARAKEQEDSDQGKPPDPDVKRPKEGPAPGGPGVAPAG